ncbi:MAG: DoxX family protein [Longimicrobiales bacterium]
MQSDDRPGSISNRALWAGRIASAFAVLFLLFDSVIKLMQIDAVAESLAQLGYPVSIAFAIGALEFVCIAVYVVPRTSVLGAILLTGYLGGAVASHLRIGSPFFTHTFFPFYIGLAVWGGLLLRDARLRALVPLRTPDGGFPARNPAPAALAQESDGRRVTLKRQAQEPRRFELADADAPRV